MPLVAGIDSSTSACKVEVRDAESGELVATGRAPHPVTTPPRSEQHPHDWWVAFEDACAEAGVFGQNRPSAIAIAGQQHGLVVLDVRGEVLRPAKLWNDTESAPDAEALISMLGPSEWAAACGSVPLASFTITKLRWLRRCEPDVFRRVAQVLLPHDWLTRQLTGAATTDRGEASGTGWWSPREECYRYDLLELVDDTMSWETVVPEVLAPIEPAGEWEGMVVGPGTGDNMAATLGIGPGKGDIVLSIGTSGTSFCVSDHPTDDESGAVAGFADATGRCLPLVCTLNATKVTDAVARLLAVGTTELDALALSTAGGAGGLVLVPYFDGERTPNRPGDSGLLSGIRSDVSREHLARAAFEGVVCNLLAGIDELVRRVPAAAKGNVILIGGGARSRAYQQIVADLSGRPVVVPVVGEPVARGAAVQAAAVLLAGSFDDLAGTWGLGHAMTVDPDPNVDGPAIRAAYVNALQEVLTP